MLSARPVAALLALILTLPAIAAEHREAVQFNQHALELTETKVTFNSGLMHLKLGHQESYPGVTLMPAKADHWDWSSFAALEVRIRNLGKHDVVWACRVDSKLDTEEPHTLTSRMVVKGGAAQTMRIALKPLPPADAPVLFGMRGYPSFARGAGKTEVDPQRITKVILFSPRPSEDQELIVEAIEVMGTNQPVIVPEKPFPLIDTFGQFIHADWPGKVHSLAELQQKKETEAAELAAKPAPEDWDQYGGWQRGPALKATGFFRTEKYNGKWYLVDPEGRLFFSHGVDCVTYGTSTPVDEREKWFADFPGAQPEFADLLKPRSSALHGYYKGKSGQQFSFPVANLRRKYGPTWEQDFARVTQLRLRSWGLNTIANWSDRALYAPRKTPYTAVVYGQGRMIEGGTGYWTKFQDVFDPSFLAKRIEAMRGEVGKSVGDPWCIGYFLDNELSWQDTNAIAGGALASPATQPAKQALIGMLKEKYSMIDQLNAAWGTSHASWDALLAFSGAPDKIKAKADMDAFCARYAEEYFRQTREAVKHVASNQLYLGCRFAWTHPAAEKAAATYCDVVSYNLYTMSIASFKPGFSDDVPLIVGEFHFGALDRGMAHTGLVPVANQQERAAAYRRYVEGALKHPQFVGTHWFEYRDEPYTGRSLDEENYQIGLVDVADTPYTETIEALRQVGYNLYKMRASQPAPDEMPR